MSRRVPLSYSELDRLIKEIQPLKQSFDFLDDHVIITDPNANILYANKAVERNTGFFTKEILGKNPGDLWGGNMPKEFYEEMWHTIKEEKKPFVGEVQNKRKDGIKYWQEVHISPILDETGEVKFFIGVEPNITDRKEKEKFREEFISILSHQLRSPIVTIKWLAESLLKKAKFTKEQIQKIEEIHKSSKSLVGLIADLLTLFRIGDIGMSGQSSDLVVDVEEIVDSVKQRNPGVSVSFDHDSLRFPLRVNKLLSSQVFLNLISNAATYSDKKKGEVLVGFRKTSIGDYIFSVENNGLSILPEDHSKIFTKLFRSEGAKKISPEGTGLGLFIVKLICDKLGWEVTFLSPRPNKDNGTVFFVKMPKT